MSRFLTCLFLCLSTVSFAHESGLDAFLLAVDQKQKDIRAKPAAQLLELDAKYLRALESMETAARSKGELERVLAIRDEIEHLGNERETLDPSGQPADLVHIRASYLQMRAKELFGAQKEELAFLTMVISRLEALKIQLTQTDRIEEAVKANDVLVGLKSKASELHAWVSAAAPPAPTRPVPANASAKVLALKQKAEVYFNFDRKADHAVDLTGKGHHATLHGAEMVREGKGIGAAQLDGEDDYLSFDPEPFDEPGPVSISLWVKGGEKGFAGKYPRLIHKADASGESACFGISAGNHTQTLTAFHQQYSKGHKAKGQVAVETSEILENDTWYHVVMTFDGADDIQIYLNGEPSQSRRAKGITWICEGENCFEIGRLPGGNRGYFQGWVDEVLVWKTALEPDEVQALYASY